MKRAFIVHKWGGTPSSDWYPWLKESLEAKGISTFVLSMPDTDEPKMENWVPYLAAEVGDPDSNTYLIGHSMGCQAILRYLERLKPDEIIGGALLVASFITIKKGSMSSEDDMVLKPWLERKIDLQKAGKHANSIVSICSDNDPYIPADDAELFRKELGSKVIMIPKAGHFTQGDGYKELHVALNEILKMSSPERNH
jgi:uncharacterized protein